MTLDAKDFDSPLLGRVMGGFVYEECHHSDLRRWLGRYIPFVHRPHPAIDFVPDESGEFAIAWNKFGIFALGERDESPR